MLSRVRNLAGGVVALLVVGLASVAQVAEQVAVTGAITQVGADRISIQPRNGQAVAITINDATVIKINGQVGKAADLKVGMYGGAFGQRLSMGEAATEIRAYVPASNPPPGAKPAPAPKPAAPKPTFTGTITHVGATSITLQPYTRTEIVVPFTDATVVKIGDQTAKVTDLKPGMRAYGFALPGQPATEIRAYMPSTTPPASPALSGRITALGTDSVTIQPKEGRPVVVTVNAATVVKVNGQLARLSDLKVDMNALAIGEKLSTGQPAAEIRAYLQK